MHRTFALGIFVTVFSFCQPAAAQDAQAGKAAYDRIGCWSCHGYEGQGGRHGPPIARPQMSYEAFSAFVRTTSGEMPPFTARVLREEDLADIYAYLRAIPEPPDPRSLPLLQ